MRSSFEAKKKPVMAGIMIPERHEPFSIKTLEYDQLGIHIA